MGSTATEDSRAKAAVKDGRDSGKAGTARKAVSRKTRSGKKPSGKKTVPKNRQTDASQADKPLPAVKQAAGKSRKKAQPEQPVPQAEDVAINTTTATDKPAADTRSISWMSAQAISALNAVKANQAKKAESLLARVEKPVPGKPGITELPVQTSEDLLEEFPGMEAAAPAAAPAAASQEPVKTPPAAAGDTPKVQKETTVMQDKPEEQEPAATESAENTTETAVTADTTSTEPAAVASTEAVVAAQAQSRGLPVRSIVMTVFLALLAYTGYNYWQENRDSGVTAPPVAGSYKESTQGAAWDDIPQQQAIAVVGTTTGEAPAPAATTPDNAAEVAAQPDATATDELASTPARETPGSAIETTHWKPDTGAAQPAADVVPPPADQAAIEAAQPTADVAPPPAEQAAIETAEPAAAVTTSEPPQPKAAAVVTQPARPARPQPGYGAPGYGYYPPQPNWQQPYYQPAYPQQYPAR
ncbi:MAG: hypothetical protein PVG72_04660 [Gammaproteobacteria bacterium]|jgi:hypothetical protein